MHLFYLISFLLIVGFGLQSTNAQILTSELENLSGEEIANRTYMAELTALQKFLFDKYHRKIRPVKNQSLPIRIQVHVYIMHYSVNQLEQTITVNGHIYMTWDDEMAVWDPAQYNNIRSTMAKQWDIWQPDLKVANSVSGVNAYFEISKRSHVTLTHISTSRTKIEVYPTFAVRIGCNFDYSDYPFDEQICAMRLYTTQVMSEVELTIYYDMHPSIMLAWGEQSEKRHISDWELLSAYSNLTYYKNRKYIDERPSNAWELQNTWTLLLVWIKLRRNSSLYWIGLALPAFVSTFLNIGSFGLAKSEYSILVVLLNFFVESIFLHDAATKELPPVVGNLPRIVRYLNSLLVMTMIALGLHLWSLKIKSRKLPLSSRYVERIRPFLKYVTPATNKDRPETFENGNTSSETSELFGENSEITAIVFRNCCAIIYCLITFFLFTIFLF